MSQATSNIDENYFDLLKTRLDQIDFEQSSNEVYQQLDDWCCKAHEILDQFYTEKRTQIDHLIEKRRKKFDELKNKLQSIQTQWNSIEENQEENLKLNQLKLRSIEHDVELMEEGPIKIHFSPLKFEDSSIEIEEEFDLDRFSTEPVRLPYTQECSAAIATNSTDLLCHQHPFLLLIHEDGRLVKSMRWEGDWIRDMTWSNALKSFVIITADQLFLLDRNFKLLNQQTIAKRWFSCTTSNTSLFLSAWEWSSSVYRFDLSTVDLDFHSEREPIYKCSASDGIHDIQSNQKALALLIKDFRESKRRMDLKSIETMETLWSFPLTTSSAFRLFTCAPIKYNEWLVVDGNTNSIYHINHAGKVKKIQRYPSVPYRVCLLASNRLVVSAENDLNIHCIAH